MCLPRRIKRFGYHNGELRLWLGWAQEARAISRRQGCGNGAAANWNLLSKEQPENYQLLGDLALANMGLGDKAAAFGNGRASHGRNPYREGPDRWTSACRDSRAGGCEMAEPDRAIAALQKLLAIPYDSPSGVAINSCAAPARSNVRSAPERSAFTKS